MVIKEHKTYITFGFDHIHTIDGQIFDKNCVAVITTESAQKGRERAFELFGNKWCFEYPEANWKEEKLIYFPRGYVYIE